MHLGLQGKTSQEVSERQVEKEVAEGTGGVGAEQGEEMVVEEVGEGGREEGREGGREEGEEEGRILGGGEV